MYNIVFLMMNVSCSKHIQDKKNQIKTLKKVHFVGYRNIYLDAAISSLVATDLEWKGIPCHRI